MNTVSLSTLVKVFKKSTDPRDPKGVRHDYHGTLALVFLGLLARLPYIAHIERWAQKHWHALRAPLGFKRTKPPVDTTISRILAKVSLEDLQNDFAEFLNAVLMEDHDTLAAAVDGCEPHRRIAPGSTDSRFETTLPQSDREAGSNSAVRLRT